MSEDRAAIDRRLSRIEGQVRGVRRLLAEDAYCCDVLNQVNAIDSALGQVKAHLAAQHIRGCVLGHGPAHPTAEGMSREHLMDELAEVLQRIVR